MTGITIPNLSGIARMVPIFNGATAVNVGASWVLDAYTVPAKRIAAIDWVLTLAFSGTLPTTLQVGLFSLPNALVRLIRRTSPALNEQLLVTNTVWLPEGERLRFQTVGGDATTDIMWSFAGREFDWVDVT